MIRTRTTLALAAATALLLLTGCSGGGSNSAGVETGDTTATTEASSSAPATSAPAADQSKADACQIVQTQFQEVSKAGSSLDTSDPQTAMSQFRDLASQIDTEFAGITNEEVAPAAQKAGGALNDYVTFLEGVIADPSKANGIGEQVTALQQSFTDAATVCAG